MKSLLAVLGLVLFGMIASGCVTDPPVANDPLDEAAQPVRIVTVPPELAFSAPDGTMIGNQFTATTNACHVTLLFCADPRTRPPFNPPLPSYCQNGGCSDAAAFSAARSLCRSICGNINCNVLAEFASSSGC